MTPVTHFDRKEHESCRGGNNRVKEQQRVRSVCINREIKTLIFIEAFVMQAISSPAITQIENRIMSE